MKPLQWILRPPMLVLVLVFRIVERFFQEVDEAVAWASDATKPGER